MVGGSLIHGLPLVGLPNIYYIYVYIYIYIYIYIFIYFLNQCIFLKGCKLSERLHYGF